jgi:tryptophan-rich sensory protein
LKPLSGIMMAPYWLWTSFAAVLNASIWWLNRG